jgi:Flp pilus assembly protein TadG
MRLFKSLSELRRCRRGNTLAIVGAALVPLTGVIGSGVDMSRAYLAKSRLQTACDAAALAGRRVMVGDTMSAEVTTEARRFFNFNFQQGLYDTATFTPEVSRSGVGTVRVRAATTIPTAIMKIFGINSLPLTVECDASQNYVNTDVMLVLDTTGSMMCTPEETSCTRTTEISTSRIVALRSAVLALYDALAPTQAQLEAAGMRLRYGVVPYSSAVNVGGLIRGIPTVGPSYLTDTTTYPSRVANYNTISSYDPSRPTGSSAVDTSETHGSTLNQAACNTYGANRSYPTNDGAGPFTVSGSPESGTHVTRTYFHRDWGGTGTTSGTNRTCRRYRRDTTTTYAPNYSFSNATYRQVAFDTSQFKLGNAVTLATNDGGTVQTAGSYSPQQLPAVATGEATTSTTWNGCIMERDTVSTITSTSGLTVPSGAFDLDINLIPNSDATRWRPMWPEAVHRRAAGSATATTGDRMTSQAASFFACPSPARRLTAWTRTALQTYVDDLDAIGGTYHDIGMLWGARLVSPGGIFADSPNVFNSMPVSRHIIFMTDGDLAPNCNTYTSYGVEQNDMRVTGAGSCPQQNARHLQRFKMICNSAKNLPVSIWVIAFGNGTSLTQDLIDCASNAQQASTAANQTQLIAKFTEIGQNIGALRLTQ